MKYIHHVLLTFLYVPPPMHDTYMCVQCDTDKQLMPPPLAPPPRPLSKNGVGSNGTPFNRFARDSTRQSLANNDSMFKWLEAQQRNEDIYQVG